MQEKLPTWPHFFEKILYRWFSSILIAIDFLILDWVSFIAACQEIYGVNQNFKFAEAERKIGGSKHTTLVCGYFAKFEDMTTTLKWNASAKRLIV